MKFLAAAASNHDTFQVVEATIAQCTTKPSGVGRSKRWAAGHALGACLILQRWWECLLATKCEEPRPMPPEASHAADSRCGQDESDSSPCFS
jgi:hypothetical protein